MFGALLAILFFWPGNNPKCPSYWPETVPLYENYTAVRHQDGTETEIAVATATEQRGATSTINFKKVVLWNPGDTMVLFGTRQIGTTTNQQAVDHNKRVKDCKTINGEF